MATVKLDPFGQEVCRLLQQRGFDPYPVGGYVRDLILGRSPVDLDLAVPHEGRRAARLLADALGGAYYPLDDETDTGRVVYKHNGTRYIIDIARWRGRTLHEDLSGRDFTINAMALDLHTGEIVDPFHGQRDLEKKRVRMLRPEVFLDDPVRLLRGPRICAQLAFTLDEETQAAINTFAALITRAQQAGEVSDSIDPDDLAALILALIQGLAMRWSLENRRFDLKAEGLRLLGQLLPAAQD